MQARPPPTSAGSRNVRIRVPQSVRRHGATTRGGADRTTRDAGRRPTDPTWTARGVVAQWATPRDVPTTPIQIPIARLPSSPRCALPGRRAKYPSGLGGKGQWLPFGVVS